MRGGEGGGGQPQTPAIFPRLPVADDHSTRRRAVVQPRLVGHGTVSFWHPASSLLSRADRCHDDRPSNDPLPPFAVAGLPVDFVCQGLLPGRNVFFYIILLSSNSVGGLIKLWGTCAKHMIELKWFGFLGKQFLFLFLQHWKNILCC